MRLRRTPTFKSLGKIVEHLVHAISVYVYIVVYRNEYNNGDEGSKSD
jgi:hypothetical protein